MTSQSYTAIDIFKKREKKHQSEVQGEPLYHTYFIYDYTDMESEEENVNSGDIISLLDKIPSKYKIIKDYDYSDKCYVIELISYTINKGVHNVIGEFKLKFGII